MSRYYEMQINVNGVNDENFEKVMDVLEEIWWDETIDDVKDTFEESRETEMRVGDTLSFNLCQTGFLCGGEGEEEFAKRVYENLKEIEPKIKIDITAILLEDRPSTDYSFGYDEDEILHNVIEGVLK